MVIFLWLLYLVIIIACIITCCFVAYHLKKYSQNSPLNKILLPIFIIISILLLFSNLLLFSSINWEKLTSKLPF